MVHLHLTYTSHVQGMISQIHSRGNPSHSMVSLVSITLIHSIFSQLCSIFHKVHKLKVCLLLALLEECLRHPDHLIQVQWGGGQQAGPTQPTSMSDQTYIVSSHQTSQPTASPQYIPSTGGQHQNIPISTSSGQYIPSSNVGSFHRAHYQNVSTPSVAQPNQTLPGQPPVGQWNSQQSQCQHANVFGSVKGAPQLGPAGQGVTHQLGHPRYGAPPQSKYSGHGSRHQHGHGASQQPSNGVWPKLGHPVHANQSQLQL